MTGWFPVGDCFVVLRTPRNDGLVSRGGIASSSCGLLAMTDWFPVSLRASYASAAISAERTVQWLYVFHAGDCFVVLRTPRNDGLDNKVSGYLSLRASYASVAISY